MAARLEALALAACLAAALPACAADVGTLFHSAEERARLDKLRRGEPEALVASPSAAAQVTGFVRRSDGRGTVWINGVPVVVAGPAARQLLDPRAVRPPGDGEVKVEAVRPPQVKR